MITEVTMPSMGADMTEGTIVKWLKKEGDEVKRGDKLAEIETDKTVVEMESYGEGILKKIVVSEGQVVPVGDLIAYVGEDGDELPDPSSSASAEATFRKLQESGLIPTKTGAKYAKEQMESAMQTLDDTTGTLSAIENLGGGAPAAIDVNNIIERGLIEKIFGGVGPNQINNSP